MPVDQATADHGEQERSEGPLRTFDLEPGDDADQFRQDVLCEVFRVLRVQPLTPRISEDDPPIPADQLRPVVGATVLPNAFKERCRSARGHCCSHLLLLFVQHY